MVKRFIKRVTKPFRKVAKKIIPKEVIPFLPYAAAFTPGLQGLAAAGGITNAAAQKALIAGLTSAATDEEGDPFRTALLAAAPDVLSQGLGSAGRMLGDANPESKFAQYLVSKGTGLEATLNNPGVMDMAKIGGVQASVDQAAKFAEINQDEIDKYNEELRKKGVLDKTKRRTSILNIYLNAGYEPDYVNSMLDRYGYAEGGIMKAAAAKMSTRELAELLAKKKKKKENKAFGGRVGLKGGGDAMMLSTLLQSVNPETGENYTIDEATEIVQDYLPQEDISGGLQAAAAGVEKAFGRGFGNVEPVPMLRFSRGGEVEIEEETDDLDIMDFMRDQGIEYGEQASDINNERVLEQLYEEFLDMGLSPADAAKAARDAFDRMSRKEDNSGIMQMASGYKTDIEEMYEQYVFEMEEQGLQPMSFSDFLAQARSGMADGGRVNMKVGGILNIMQGLSKLKTMVVNRLSRMTDDVELRGSSDYAEDTGASFELTVTAKSKKGKKTLDGLVEEGVVEKLDENNYFISDGNRDAISGMKGLKASGMFDEGAETFTRFDEGAGRGVMDMPYYGYDEVIDTFKKQKKADGGEVDMMTADEYFKKKGKQKRLDDYEKMRSEYEEYKYRKKYGPRDSAAEGGLMNRNLLNTGMDKDMRGGGFIPEGTKERADDVPARLSKNEFVMTADAVRAAGGGSVNKGAKRTYDMMYQLEGKV